MERVRLVAVPERRIPLLELRNAMNCCNDDLFATPTRRNVLELFSLGFGMLALRGLLADDKEAPQDPLAPKQPHFPARAKRVIFLCMAGAPSHVDTFDYKPELTKHD